jgi:hypothetical protein
MRGKRAQFFLLAAVIISAVIISLGAATNRAVVNDESDDFYVYSNEAQREVAAFLDYAAYSDIGDDELVDFLDLLAQNMKEMNPNVDFAFVYGDGNNKVSVRNYGSRDVYVNGDLVEARAQVESDIYVGGILKTILLDGEVATGDINLKGSDSFLIKVNEDADEISFPASGYRQVIVVAQKEERGDIYVSIG